MHSRHSSGVDPEVRQALNEINDNLKCQNESKEKEDTGKKPNWKKITDLSKRTILRLGSSAGTSDMTPAEPNPGFLEFTAVGSTANAQMLFQHVLTKKKCRAFPSKGMITALFGGMLLPLDGSQGLGFNTFGLPSTASTEASSESDLLQNRINPIDGQGITREGAEKMAETRLSLIYSFTDLCHRMKSLLCGYGLVTREDVYFTKKIRECAEIIDLLETQITRNQNRWPRFMTELGYMVTRKMLLCIESCRNVEDGLPFATRHLNFDTIWNKIELGGHIESTLPPCLENRFKSNMRLPPQDAGGGNFRGGGIDKDIPKNGRERYGRNTNRGEVVHNERTIP